jgi:hypothetical protein
MMGLFFLMVVGAVCGAFGMWGLITQCPDMFSLVHGRWYREEREAKWKAEDFADGYERMLAQSQRLTQKYLVKLQKAERDSKSFRKLGEAGHWENLAREYKRRIDAFLVQRAKIKSAYQDRVRVVSHGQQTVEALTDPEKYLLHGNDGVSISVAELMRRCECSDADAAKSVQEMTERASLNVDKTQTQIPPG